MKALCLLLLAWPAYAQTCQYQMVSYPSGAVQVFRNGLLLRQGADFSYSKPAGKNPLISPLLYSAGDQFTVTFPHKVSLSGTVGGVSFPYTAYQNWLESWTCTEGNTGPVPWIPPTCTFANPPGSPSPGQTCIFLDADLFRSCQPAAEGRPSGWETCRWAGDRWQTTAVPLESPLFPGGTARAVECLPGQVSFAAVNPGTASVELTIFSVDASIRWDHIMVAETEQFLPDIGLTVSMGRPGTNHLELSRAPVPLGISAGNAKPWTERPIPPQIFGQYPIVLNFEATGGHLLQELTAGSLYWEVCGYRVGPILASPARLAGLAECSGAGTSTDPATGNATAWNCAGIWKASIFLQDGSALPLVGVKTTDPGAGVWTAR